MRSKRDPEDDTHSERDDTGPSFYERAIRTTIGRGLRSYYDLTEPMPERMTKLLQRIDENAPPADKNGTAEAEQKDKSSK
jgi:hypothetical protein